MRAGQGLKLTTSRRPGDVINCHREDQYSLSGGPRDVENLVGTDLLATMVTEILLGFSRSLTRPAISPFYLKFPV